MRFQIRYTGKTIDKFPKPTYHNPPATADAYEVITSGGVVVLVGTVDMCENFIRNYF